MYAIPVEGVCPGKRMRVICEWTSIHTDVKARKASVIPVMTCEKKLSNSLDDPC